MADSHDVFGASSLALSQTVGLWFALNPDFLKVRETNPQTDPVFTDAMRDSETVAALVSVAVSTGASLYARSPFPLIVTMVTLVGLWFVFEHGLTKLNNPIHTNYEMSETNG